MTHVFGPVPSRRLGLSLGVDLIPSKTCTFDCIYCQVGRTTNKTLEEGPFVPVGEVVAQIEERLLICTPDVITLAGSGEPTLYSEIAGVIQGIKGITKTDVVLLTNGSLFWREEVRRRVLEADIIMPTLSSAFDATFRSIHRPHHGLDLKTVVKGLRLLRKDYTGRLYLEVVLLAGINDTQREIRGLKALIDRIHPEKIQLNTVVRPPSDARAKPLDRDRLEEIKLFFGEKAEIIATTPVLGKAGQGDLLVKQFLDMVKRRPLSPTDAADSLGLSLEGAEGLIKGLVIKGFIRRQEHLGEVFYLINEEDGR